MSQQIFTEAWLQLSAKQKSDHIEAKLLGLRPAIVYLDDESDALEVFSERCEQLGLEAIVSSDQKKLLEYITSAKQRILMIVSDYSMPVSNGFEFRQKVLQVAGDIPFYILSGHVDRELALQGVKHKIGGFLNKPMHKDHFIELLRSEGEARALTMRDDYEMLKSFTDDVMNIVAEIEDGCLHLENDPRDAETVSRIFGLVHTVKGSSGFFEPRTLHLFAHSFEEILKLVLAGQMQVTTPLISTWLKGCDIIKTLNEEFITGVYEDYDVEELKKVLKVTILSESPETAESSDHLSEKKLDVKEIKSSDLKVSMRVLDEFTQVSGELTVIRNMINKVVGAIEKQYPSDKDVQVLSELLEEMHKINSDMQTKITDIRRVSVSQLIKPLTRNIRDTSKALGKDVDFVFEGEELRLDNAIADTLSRCLVHLMRNSLDHGLESNEERKNIGKPFKGKLSIKFQSINESIIVTLEDDGRGINTDKIRQKVISQGLRSSEDATKMTDEELHLMIFEAGFSTAAQVTEFSGRGVGMSMVKETIEQQQGKIRIQSEKGKGSKFILEIPIPKSVLITNCLFVTSGEMTFGIPQEFVIRVLDQNSLSSNGVENLDRSRFIRFEGQLVPVISLARTLSLDTLEQENLLVVLDTQGIIFALEVAQVHDTEDAVIKPLNVNSLKALGVYQGGTFLGDGTVGLIMDAPGLAEKLSLKKTTVQKVVEDNIHKIHRENVISFGLDYGGTFAVREKDVFRVEVFSSDEAVGTAGIYVMPYRNSILTLVHVEELVFGKRAALEKGQQLPTLIIKHKNQYLGLIVREIQDLEPVEMNIVPSLKKKQGVKGNILHKGSILVMLELDEIRKILEEDRLHEDLPSASAA